MTFIDLAQEIRAARKGRTQMSVAAAANITRSYLCDIEKGYRVPPPETIKRLAGVLGLEPDRWLWLWLAGQMGSDDLERAVRYGTSSD